MGSSLQVTPAADLPLKTTKKYEKDQPGKLVIVNLQKTPRDDWADMLIRYYVDDVISIVMESLGIEIPESKKLKITDLNKFCKTRKKDWVTTQLKPKSGNSEEETSSSEEEDDTLDNSVVFDNEDPDWTPNFKPSPTKRKLPTRTSARKKSKYN